MLRMRMLRSVLLIVLLASTVAKAQLAWPDLTRPQDYVSHHESSTSPEGTNDDWRPIEPGKTLTVFDKDGPAEITHLWFTGWSPDARWPKAVVLRMYWDGETTPSVEAPIGDFFGLGFGDFHAWNSLLLQAAPQNGLNSFFPMPFRKHARITLTSEGEARIGSLYYNVDYRSYRHALADDTLYFHAQYRQAAPNAGTTSEWTHNFDPRLGNPPNKDGKGNYIFL